MKALPLILFSILSYSSFGQSLPFNREAKIDTLIIEIEVSDKVPEEESLMIKNATEQAAWEYNLNPHKFITAFKKSKGRNTLTIKIEEVKYANKPGQHWAFGASIIGIMMLPATIIASDGAFFFIFWLNSVNLIKGEIQLSEDLRKSADQKPKRANFSSGGGWFRNLELNKTKASGTYQELLTLRLDYINNRLKND